MKALTHLSLFSGIGGLDLAAEWAGFKTVGQCEWADYPTKVLEKHWPDVPRWRDIRELTGENFYERTGLRTVDVISGGFPCQPFSVAGKQRGKEDDRYLWPEMVRIIKELRPTWIVGENVAGIVRMALPDILFELEACGYRTRTFLIPACAVGARHRRYRVAIVAYAGHDVLPGREYQAERSKGTACNEPEPCSSSGRTKDMEDPDSLRCCQPGNVHQQPGRAESERPGETMAHTQGERERGLSVRPGESPEENPYIERSGEDVQHPDSAGCKEQHFTGEPDEKGFPCGGCDAGNVCHSTGKGLSQWTGQPLGGQGTPEPESERPDSYVSDSDSGSWSMRWNGELSAVKEIRESRCDFGKETKEHEPGERRSVESCLGGMADGLPDWVDGYWDIEPNIPRVAAGIPHRVDRLKALGNAVVPQQFYLVFRAIAEVEENYAGSI